MKSAALSGGALGLGHALIGVGHLQVEEGCGKRKGVNTRVYSPSECRLI